MPHHLISRSLFLILENTGTRAQQDIALAEVLLLQSCNSVFHADSSMFVQGITETCHMMYHRMGSGLSPENVRFTNGSDFAADNKHYVLRPGSLHVLWCT